MDEYNIINNTENGNNNNDIVVHDLINNHNYVEKSGASNLFINYFNFINKRKYFVFGFWSIILLISLIVGPEFLTLGDDQVVAPPGSKEDKAQKEFEKRFSLNAVELNEILLFYCDNNYKDKCDIRDDDIYQFANTLRDEVYKYNKTHDNIHLIEIMDYYKYDNTVLDTVKSSLISDDYSSALMNIVVKSTDRSQARFEFLDYFKDYINENNPDKKKYQIGFTGFDQMGKDSSESSSGQLMKIDMVTLPIAFAVLGFMVHSWRLLLIGTFNMTTAILAGFAIMTLAVKSGAPHPGIFFIIYIFIIYFYLYNNLIIIKKIK